MNTEDETFRRLKRVTWLELEQRINHLAEEDFHVIHASEDAFKEFLESLGWTFEEFKIQINIVM